MNSRGKVLLVATVQSHICQFHRPLVEMLHAHGYSVEVAARDNLAEKNGLKLDFVDGAHDVDFDRSPFSTKNYSAYKQLRGLLAAEHYDYIHCNTPMGGVLTRLAAAKYRKDGTTVLYTAHGFHFYKGASIKNWLLYYPVEKVLARWTDRLITITAEDYALAKKRFATNVSRIHGVGASAERFLPADTALIREQLGYELSDKLVLCVGELLPNKNQETAIRAMAQVMETMPSARLLIAGNGETSDSLNDLASELSIADRVDFLGYRTDIDQFVKACDVVVTCSYREGLPLNVLEAMLCEKPVIASDNRGHRELVEDGKTGFLLSPNAVDGFAQRLRLLLSDKALRSSMGSNAAASAQPFTADNVKRELEEIYFG